jgi:2-C-methyl-D-erythritol 4-phosphate cytidylyltransferase / 2-C-methyl-D-erythritol 2,4-cyclodiphosphate synthase
MFVTAIIAAGGRGLRLGGDRPKQLLEVGGRAILDRSVSAFLVHTAVSEVIVALPEDLLQQPPGYLYSASKPLRLVAGGARRQDSVANAVHAAARESEVIVIHDAARPFASADLISRTINAAWEAGAALAAIAARDTVKRVDASSDPNDVARPQRQVVRETLARDSIYLAQTPQAFRREVLDAALAVAAREALDVTDEASLAERAGYAVRIVAGDVSNMKITTREDWLMAEAIAADVMRDGAARVAKPARTGRAGTGYDLHRLVEGRQLVLGGVTIPSDRGALGHSDADVVCHAVTDAILGAACLGDIGRHFPDTDAAWKGASSVDLLMRAVAMLAEQGLQVGNVDVTVVLERPKIRDYIDTMRASVAKAIGIDIARVSIKGKTNEGVDAVGRGEAIAAHAVALVRASGI